MIHGAPHILSFHHDALEWLVFEQSMWLTTFDYSLFHVCLFECVTAVFLGRLYVVPFGFAMTQNANVLKGYIEQFTEWKKDEKECFHYLYEQVLETHTYKTSHDENCKLIHRTSI